MRLERRGPATVAILGMEGASAGSGPVDSVVFVGGDGRTSWFESPAGRNDFVPLERPVGCGDALFQRGLTWEPPEVVAKRVFQSGVIEAVEPRWSW